MRIAALTALWLLTAAGAASAQEFVETQKGAFAPGFVPGGVFALPPAERFKAVDKNADGKVTRDEFAAVLNPDAKPFVSSIWVNRDTNKDGWLNQDELVTNGPQRRLGPPPGAAGAAPAAPAARGQ